MIVGIMPVRNEAWIIGYSLQALLIWCDHVVIALHQCTDETESIVRGIRSKYAGRVHVFTDEDSVWREMSMRHELLLSARDLNATHVVTVDADEVLTANLLPKIREMVFACNPGQQLILPWVHAWRNPKVYRKDPTSTWSTSFATTAFGDRKDLCWKPDATQYDHHHRAPYGSEAIQPLKPLMQLSQGGLIHYQHARWNALRAKQAWYKMVERIRWPNREPLHTVDERYSRALNETGLQCMQMPTTWIQPYIDAGLYKLADFTDYAVDEYWQAAQCKEFLAQHEEKTFRGLNLFGVV